MISMSILRVTCGTLLLPAILVGSPSAAFADATARVRFVGGPDQTQTGDLLATNTASYGNGAGYAYADLATGVLRASTTSATDVAGVYESAAVAAISDSITFSAGAQGTALLHYDLDGTFAPQRSHPTDTAMIFVLVSGSNSGIVRLYQDLATDGTCGSSTQSSQFCHIGTSIAVSGVVDFPILTTSMNISISLAETSFFGSTVDFSNTAHFWLEVPTGVTYTSASGHFLEFASPPVPEPATSMLLCLGLAGIGLLCNGRKSSANRTLTVA